MSASALYTAIKTRAATLNISATLGTLYVNSVPPNSVLPYWKLLSLENKVNQAFGIRYFEDFGLQFSIHTTSLADALSYQEALHVGFDNLITTLSQGVNIGFRRTGDWIVTTESTFTDKNGNPVYHAISRYVAQVDMSFNNV